MRYLRESAWNRRFASGGGQAVAGRVHREQMLFDHSEEGSTPGLGLFPGEVVRFRDAAMRTAPGVRLKVPHMGWNACTRHRRIRFGGCPGRQLVLLRAQLLRGSARRTADCRCVRLRGRFTCAVARDNIFATQFHPEKSAAAGLRIYENFCRWAP